MRKTTVKISVINEADARITAFLTNRSIRWVSVRCWFLCHIDCFTRGYMNNASSDICIKIDKILQIIKGCNNDGKIFVSVSGRQAPALLGSYCTVVTLARNIVIPASK